MDFKKGNIVFYTGISEELFGRCYIRNGDIADVIEVNKVYLKLFLRRLNRYIIWNHSNALKDFAIITDGEKSLNNVKNIFDYTDDSIKHDNSIKNNCKENKNIIANKQNNITDYNVYNAVSFSEVNRLFREAEKREYRPFTNTYILACKLENGFIIVESFSAANSLNLQTARKICEEKILNKIWEHETYLLKTINQVRKEHNI